MTIAKIPHFYFYRLNSTFRKLGKVLLHFRPGNIFRHHANFISLQITGKPILQIMHCHFTEYSDERNKAGFFSILNQLIFSIAEHQRSHEGNLDCIQAPSLEQFFEFRNISVEKCYNEALDFRKELVSLGSSDPYNAHVVCPPQEILNKRKIYDDFLSLKSQYVSQNSKFRHSKEKILGIHIRGTDKFKEVLPPTKKQIVAAIQKVLKNYPVDNIYLATDDLRYHKLIQKHFGEKLMDVDVSHLDPRRKPLHLAGSPNDSKITIDRRALEDVQRLADCNYFLYSMSNLSHFALIYGAHRHELVEPIPMNKKPRRIRRLLNRGKILLEAAEVFGRRISSTRK